MMATMFRPDGTDREVDNAIVQTAQVTEKLTAVNVDNTDQTIPDSVPQPSAGWGKKEQQIIIIHPYVPCKNDLSGLFVI